MDIDVIASPELQDSPLEIAENERSNLFTQLKTLSLRFLVRNPGIGLKVKLTCFSGLRLRPRWQKTKDPSLSIFLDKFVLVGFLKICLNWNL